MDGRVLCLASAQGALYAGGEFTRAGETPASRIARWDGEAWSALGEGVDGRVLAIAADGVGVVAGGEFTSGVARWDGSAWQALGGGTDGAVQTLVSYKGDLVAGGEFTRAGDAPALRVARWDGEAWSALGEGADGSVTRLMPWGDRLVAAGHFNHIGTVSASHLAVWDGLAWQPLADGVDDAAFALASFDQDWSASPGEPRGLVVGGPFERAGGVPSERIAILTPAVVERAALDDPSDASCLRLVVAPAIGRAARLAYMLPGPARVALTVHDLEGRRVATLVDGWEAAGAHESAWAPPEAAAGIYFLRLRAGSRSATARLVRID
jgi:hypothetical protein